MIMRDIRFSVGALLLVALAACSDDVVNGDPVLVDDVASADVGVSVDAAFNDDTTTVLDGNAPDADDAEADTEDSDDVASPLDVVERDVIDAADEVTDAASDAFTVDDVEASDDVEAPDTEVIDATPDVAADVAPDAAIEYLYPASMGMGTFTSLPWLMNVTPDGVSVMWETSDVVAGEVYWGFSPDEMVAVVSESASRNTHEVRLSGLPPSTTIWYRVGQRGSAIEPLSFRTAPEPSLDASYSFVVWGDNQNGPSTFSDLTPMMADLDPDFAVSTGDCVQNGTRREFREQLLVPIGPLASRVPFLVGAGNHERYSDPSAALFNEYMSQPGDEHCFGWRYGDLYLVFIDTELSFEVGTPQYDCIVSSFRSDEATSARFQGAVFHKPPRIEYWFGGVIAFPDSMEAPRVREFLEPLFETLGVDIVFNGHNHLYAHTPETDGGITWVTTGGAGGSLDSLSFIWRVGDWPEIETQISTHHFLYVTVTGGVMEVTAINRDGNPIHEFAIAR